MLLAGERGNSPTQWSDRIDVAGQILLSDCYCGKMERGTMSLPELGLCGCRKGWPNGGWLVFVCGTPTRSPFVHCDRFGRFVSIKPPNSGCPASKSSHMLHNRSRGYKVAVARCIRWGYDGHEPAVTELYETHYGRLAPDPEVDVLNLLPCGRGLPSKDIYRWWQRCRRG